LSKLPVVSYINEITIPFPGSKLQESLMYRLFCETNHLVPFIFTSERSFQFTFKTLLVQISAYQIKRRESERPQNWKLEAQKTGKVGSYLIIKRKTKFAAKKKVKILQFMILIHFPAFV
jgi:hypothetical protein